MLKSQSPKKTTPQGHSFKKNVQNYTISYCPKQFLGRSLYGEVRLGYENTQKKIKAIRINPLPLSQQSKSNLWLQKQMSKLQQCSRTIYETIQSQSNRYTIMQYFPKTFKTELSSFRKLTKNMQPYIQKLLHTYSKLYYLRIPHGNLTLDNIGITYDNRVKLMDFREVRDLGFEDAAKRDYRDFRNLVGFVLERDRIFPRGFEVFDQPDGGDWERIFSVWHVVNPYQFVYRIKKQPMQNIVVLLSKLESTIYFQEESKNAKQSNVCHISGQEMPNLIKIGLRLLMLSLLKKIGKKSKIQTQQIAQLQKILHPCHSHDQSFYNSLIWGCITDCKYYKLSQMQRLTLIMCLLPFINHEYFYMEILKEFQPNKDQMEKFQIYSDHLIKYYSDIIITNLIQF